MTAPTAGTTLPPMARRVEGYMPSAVRAIFAKANAPGMISLAGGAPFLGALPLAEIAREASDILSGQGETALQYSFGVGTEALRRHICSIMKLEGIEVDPDAVVVTAGSQMALEATCKVMLDPGDVVIAEGPCYSGGLSALLSYEADLRHARTDDQGMIVEHVEQLIDEARAEGKTVKFVYCIPTFQNPKNTMMPPARRRQIAELCRDRGVLLLEDNAYGLLSFDGSYVRAIKADYPDQVAYMGSFSKMFGPGLRLGWIVPPEPLRRKIIDTVETAVLNPPTFGQFLMSSYLDQVDWQGELVAMRDVYRKRCDALIGALKETMPSDVSWVTPTGSFYLWLTLPDELDADEIMEEALNRKVAVVPGSAYYVDGQGRQEMRLSYCLPTEEQLDTAGRILGQLVTEKLAEARSASS